MRKRSSLRSSGARGGGQGARLFAADGESGKRFGNETIRVTPGGEISVKLPAPLAHLANAPHGRYVLAAKVSFAHRGEQWADRVAADRAIAYRIHEDTVRGRWYLTASWTIPPVQTVPLAAARAGGLIGFDANADHLAAWRLDAHGNPCGEPRRFFFDLDGPASYRDAQVRHALIRLLHWAARHGLNIAIEDLDFDTDKTREKHGRRKPGYTSKWGAQHWQKPLSSTKRATTRHDAASVAIGRRALGHGIRRRAAPPHTHRSDGCGHRTAQAGHGARGREERRPASPDHEHDPMALSVE